MADLNSFAVPVLGTGYVDVVDSLRANINAAMTGVSSGRAGAALGATNLSGPNTYNRTLTQYNGTTYLGFSLSVDKLKTATSVDFTTLANFTIAANIGNGNPGINFDGNDFNDFDRVNNIWRIVVAGVPKLQIDSGTTYMPQQTIRQNFAGENYAIQYNDTAPLDQKSWIESISANQKVWFVQNDARTNNTIYDEITRSGLAITQRRMMKDSGRLLVGQGLTDDGSTMLQTGTLKATSLTLTAQPAAQSGQGSAVIINQASTASLIYPAATLVTGGITYNSANGLFTVPAAGNYDISFSFSASVSATNAVSITAKVFINGVGEDVWATTLINGFPYFLNARYLRNLNAGDTIDPAAASGPSLGGADYITCVPRNLQIIKRT